MDCFIMDPVSFEVSLSMIQLQKRYQERKILESDFQLSGGRFVKLEGGQDPELSQFETSLPQTELTVRLL